MELIPQINLLPNQQEAENRLFENFTLLNQTFANAKTTTISTTDVKTLTFTNGVLTGVS